jgi:hypothetical protein
LIDGGRDPSGVGILRDRKPIRKANRLAALRMTAGSASWLIARAPWSRRSKYERYPGGLVFVAEVEERGEASGGGEAGEGPGGAGAIFFVKNRETVLGASLRLVDSRGGSPYMDWGDAGVPTRAPSFTFSMWAVIQRFGVWRPFTNSF